MKNLSDLKKYNLIIALILSSFIGNHVSAQSVYQPYSYQFYQKLNSVLYSTSSNEHTSLKPLFVDDTLLKHRYDSLMNYGAITGQRGGAYNKLFNEHLIDYKGTGATFYADVLPNFSIGQDFSDKLTTNTTSLGLQFVGTIGKEVSYNASVYESSEVFPNYISTYINQVGIIPGQGVANTDGNNRYDWSYVTANISYTPVDFLNISAGRDKTFIGDGYRSLLLSDYASPYPYLKLTATFGPFRYMTMYTYMNDPASTSIYNINRKKFGVFHYLDWNISKTLSFAFFESVIGFLTDDSGKQEPFDWNYVNPLIYMKPINNASADPDKSLIGFNGKFKISNGVTAYGQFALDEFHSVDFFSSNGAYDNKYAWQLGLRGTNLFTVKDLNFLIETNSAKPYTYAARSADESYSENAEPLAHPWGANFRELVGLLNYSYKRFDFSGEADLGRYGLDENGLNYGKDIFNIYINPAKVYNNYTTQGLTTNMTYVEGKVAYVINPKYNMRIELSGLYRVEQNTQFNNKTSMITLGLLSSFRQVYNDIASFKNHN